MGSARERPSFLRVNRRDGAFGTGVGYDTSPQSWVLHSNLGCCIGTTQKSETYEISGAVQRRAVPIRELVENKERRLKKKPARAAHLAIPTTAKNLPAALAAVKGQASWRGSRWSPLTAALASGVCPP